MRRIWDATAISLSALCFVHCLALPVLALSLPFLGGFAQSEYVHWLFLAIAAPLAATVFVPAMQEKPMAWALPALAGLGLTLLLGGAFDAPTHAWGTAFTVAGGMTVAAAHFGNWRKRHNHVAAVASRL